MFNATNYVYDCTRKCCLYKHGNAITAALTKCSIPDEQLAPFIAKSCCNYYGIVDELGRSAVHMAASVNRYAILEWLLNQGAVINVRDFESGSTPLHRAIYYGSIDCAVLLLRYGANPDLLDNDSRIAFQNICRLCDFSNKVQLESNNDILVWGSNKNYNLGIGNEDWPNSPKSLDFFRKQHISIDAVALGAFHSLFLDSKALLYSVGHGKGGRLGIDSEDTLPTPKRVNVPIKNAGERITCVSVSRKHSLILTNLSSVFSCGLNDYKQLGVRDTVEKLTVFKEVLTLRDYGVKCLIRVLAMDHHSIVYSEKYIYVWGTNHGQMGVDANVNAVPLPKMMNLPPRTNINFVEANNFATVILTKENLILLFYNGKMKSIKSPNYEPLKSICVLGGDNTRTNKGTAGALKLLLLTKTNVIFLWYEKTQNFHRSAFPEISLSQIDKIFYKGNQVLILSQGNVYKGKCHQVTATKFNEGTKKSNSFGREVWSSFYENRTKISKDYIVRIDLQLLSNVDRVVDIFCDDEFSSFAILQESCTKYFKQPSLALEEYVFKKLFNEVSDLDDVHDLVFHVEGEIFPAHKFLIYSRAPGLRDLIVINKTKHVYLNFEQLSAKMFEVVLKFVYMNYLPNEDDLDEIQQSLSPNCMMDRSDVCKIFLNLTEKFKLHDLSHFLKSFLQQQPFPLPHLADGTKYRYKRFRHKDFPELYDIRIVCEGNIEIPAHKCMLVARLEFFEKMFTNTWSEQSIIKLTTVPVEYMQAILDFLYSSDAEYFRKQKFSESFLCNMVVFCDQFFIEGLRKVCQVLILDKISVRKCGEMLNFACVYNCEILKHGCLEFICQNLTRVLLYRSLDFCEPDALKCINERYRTLFKDVFDYRVITPDSTAVEDVLLFSFVSDFNVDLSSGLNYDQDIFHKSVVKTKAKASKAKETARQYERDAITSMKEFLSLNDKNSGDGPEEKSKSPKEKEEVPDRNKAESKNWIKVVGKNYPKNKTVLGHASKVTGLISTEKSKTELVPLMKASKDISQKSLETIVNKTENATPLEVHLSELSAASRDKLSQKQRKRLSSEFLSQQQTPTSHIAEWAKSMNMPVPANVRTLMAQPPFLTSTNSETSTGIDSDLTSNENVMTVYRGNVGISINNNESSFIKILAEERKQREYYDRLRTKSLVLTQIEETAIAELHEFYNVDNVKDEFISVKRKSSTLTTNFAIWQRIQLHN